MFNAEESLFLTSKKPRQASKCQIVVRQASLFPEFFVNLIIPAKHELERCSKYGTGSSETVIKN